MSALSIKLTFLFQCDYHYIIQLIVQNASKLRNGNIIVTKLQNMDHQQFSYMNSQFIFYCDAEQQQKRRTISQITNRTFNTAYSKNNRYQFGKQNNRNITTSTSKYRTKNKDKIETVKFVPLHTAQQINSITCQTQTQSRDCRNLPFQPHQTQKADRNNMHELSIAKTSQYHQQSVLNPKQKYNQVYEKLTHSQIKKLLGAHHCCYKQGYDYLQKTIESQTQNQNQRGSIKQKMQQNGSKCNEVQNYSYLGSSIAIPQIQLKETNSYIFQNDRALIVQFIDQIPSKHIYETLVSMNLKSEPYTDKEFFYKNIVVTGSQKVQWIYISPQPSLPIFPSVQIDCYSQPHNYQLEWIKFMQFLYQIEPAAFTRLLEPPINNVFSVWLYFDGTYQPVIIDGYFPFDKHIFGNFPIRHWWLPIFVKCICKIIGTFDLSILKNITDAQVYNLIYGQKLQSILANQLVVSHTLNAFFNKKVKKCKNIVHKKDNEFKILEYEEKTKTIRFKNRKVAVSQNEINDGIIYEIKEIANGYIKTLEALKNKTTIYDMNTQKNCKVSFSQYGNSKCINLLIYKCELEETTGVTKLKLKYELNMKKVSMINIEKGDYKLFIDSEHGSLHQHTKSDGKDYIKENQKKRQRKVITMISSAKVKISEGAELMSKQGQLEDVSNIYLV